MTVYKWVVQPCVASYGLSTQNTRDLSLFRCISPTSNIGILHIRNAQSSSYNRGIKGERERCRVMLHCCSRVSVASCEDWVPSIVGCSLAILGFDPLHVDQH
jgi:hypothetical protein